MSLYIYKALRRAPVECAIALIVIVNVIIIPPPAGHKIEPNSATSIFIWRKSCVCFFNQLFNLCLKS